MEIAGAASPWLEKRWRSGESWENRLESHMH
jgi:hypothetical protein